MTKVRAVFDARLTPRNIWKIILEGKHPKCDLEYNGHSDPRLFLFRCFSCTQSFCAYWDGFLKREELEKVFSTKDLVYLGKRR